MPMSCMQKQGQQLCDIDTIFARYMTILHLAPATCSTANSQSHEKMQQYEIAAGSMSCDVSRITFWAEW